MLQFDLIFLKKPAIANTLLRKQEHVTCGVIGHTG